LSVILIALGGAWVLKEKLTLRLTIGSIIISLGVILVSLS
jgi:drug/metabolite transporter (DMT)-like permease